MIRGGEGEDSSSSSGGEREEISAKPEATKVQKCSVQISAKDFKVASDLAAKESNKDKDKNRLSTRSRNRSVDVKFKLNESPNSRMKGSLISIRDQLSILPPETLSDWIRAWTSDLETVLGFSWED